jgi:O-antigen biosynthesis protein
MAFDLLSYHLLLERPDRLTEIDAWHEHIPFAFFLVELQQPGVLVELGTWKGDSYCAFCQAVDALSLPTQCYAVDLWKGDDHTGPYPEQHYEELKAYHDARYGAFSRLVRSSFDDAIEQFAVGSVDLLHIDGCHRYEVVKRDFEAWQSRLSERAIVLLHDTNVRENDFGVWRLWEELSAVHPSFAFAHSHGLGVLVVGERPDPQVVEFLELASKREPQIRRLFFALGARAALDGRARRLASQLETATAEAARAWQEAIQAGEESGRAREEALQASNEAASARQEAANAWLAVEDVKREREALGHQVAQRDLMIAEIYGSRSWRITAPLRAAKRPLQPINRRIRHRARAVDADSSLDQPGPAADAGSYPAPELLISILMPVRDPPRGSLRRAIESVKAQTYPMWELCICDDGSATKDVARVLRRETRRDKRIKVVQSETSEGISGASNRAWALAQGEYVALLDHDDELAPNALFECASFLQAQPELDILYTDEDKVDLEGRFSEPFFKPDWSPEFLRGVMYVGHLLVARRSLVSKVGGFASDFDGVQDYELVLRLSEHTDRIDHLPKTLYHWRKVPGSVAADVNAKPQVPRRQVEAVNAHLERCGDRAIARAHPRIPHRVELHPEPREDWPSVSIVVAGTDRDRLSRCLESIFRHTSYPLFDVVVAAATEIDTSSDGRALTLLRIDGPLIRSRLANAAVTGSAGDVVLLVDEGVTISDPDWVRHLVWPLESKTVGVVGPVVLAPDKTVWSAGLVVSRRTVADAMRGLRSDSDGYAGSLSCSREVSGIGSTCLALQRRTHQSFGGFDESYRQEHYDADFCLRVRQAGKRVLVTPRTTVTYDAQAVENSIDRALFLDVWSKVIRDGDPYHSAGIASLEGGSVTRVAAA